MGEEITGVSQYKLTNDIIKHCYTLDLKDSTFKVLSILSIHYPNILINRKSLIKRYHIPEKTVDRALKELTDKGIISRQFDGKITVNLAALYRQIDGEKVVNLTVTCSNQHEETKITNPTCPMPLTEQDNDVVGLKNILVEDIPTESEVKQQTNNVVVSLLKGFGFNDKQIEEFHSKHASEEIEKYALYVENRKGAQNKKRYFVWCMTNKPYVEEAQTNKQKQDNGLPVCNVDEYKKLLESKQSNRLNDFQMGSVFVSNVFYQELRQENVLREVVETMLRWNLQIPDYSALLAIDEAAHKNQEFKQHLDQMILEIIEDFKLAGVPVAFDNEQSKAS